MLYALPLLLAACISSQSGFGWPTEPLTPSEREALFEPITSAQSESYGFTPEDAVRIGRYGPFKGMQASAEMIANLRRGGQSMRVLRRYSMPAGKPDSSQAVAAPYGAPPEGTILDVYMMVAEGTTDTLRLYFDVYHVASLQVPRGFEWQRSTSQ